MKGIKCKICKIFIKGNKRDFMAHENTQRHKYSQQRIKLEKRR